MGSSGRGDRDRETYETIGKEPYSWFTDHSNVVSWETDKINKNEKKAVEHYTGYGYRSINKAQYNIPWEDMDSSQKETISSLHNALNKFELKRGIIVDRACDFQIFGADKYDTMSITDIRNFLKPSNGVLQHDGFLSFSTNKDGHAIAGSGVVIHLKVPPSKGSGAYVAGISSHSGEHEFLLNNNAVIKYDYNSMYSDGHSIHINAEWQGNMDAQTISPTYKGIKLTGKGAKKARKSKK